MLIGKETGIGPALRVLRHFTDREPFYQIKFQSGERALLLAADMPVPSVELVRLALGGLLPWQIVWEYNPMRAGGYSDYIHKLKAMFSPTTERPDDTAHHIRDILLSCRSIEDARVLLLQRERLANSSNYEISDDFTRSKPHAVARDDGWEWGTYHPHESAGATLKPSATTRNSGSPGYGRTESSYAANLDRAESPTVPNRYRIRQEGKARVLTCVEAPTVTVRAERALTISAKEARRYRAGTIFLDGAAQGEPFIDVQRELYNLDHPEGCVRSVATCEQAMILISKGLDLSKRDWLVLANDADLDTLLALWALLNHNRLNSRSKIRAEIMPLFRFAGVVDAHGRDAQYLAALPPDVLHSTAATLKKLQQQESALKDYGRWAATDLRKYISDQSHAIDELVYEPEDFYGFHEIEELAQVKIADASVAIACRADADIEQVQRQLQRIYGQRLGILIFQQGSSAYSMRRIDRHLPATLERAYERLNLLDPAVSGGSENRWTGSDDIGTSPRKSGTKLEPEQIIEAVREAFWQAALVDVASLLPRALLVAAAAMLPLPALIFIGSLLRERGFIAGDTLVLSIVALTITVGILFGLRAFRAPGLNGWRVPANFAWLSVLPAALIGAIAGGVWSPGSVAHRMGPDNLSHVTGAAALLPPLAAAVV